MSAANRALGPAPATKPTDFTTRNSLAPLSIDPLTGAARLQIPIETTPGRQGIEPELALSYRSDRGNGPFGLGWSVDLPSVGRRNAPEVPRYGDFDDDTFEVGEDELVPALRVSGGWIDDRFTVGEYLIQRYRRRYESAHERVERWVHAPTGQVHWRVVDRNNVTSLFGTSDESRVSDASDRTRIGRWLLAERFDDRGNIMRLSYKAEDLEGVDFDRASERHRADQSDSKGGARYIKRIQYGNASPHDRDNWLLEVVFDYGEHDTKAPTIDEVRPWRVRPDAHSTHRDGFEVRTWRRCRRILTFHNFGELGETPTLVRSVTFGYDSSRGVSLLASVESAGYIRRANGTLERQADPPNAFTYQRSSIDSNVYALDSDVLINTLVDKRSLAHWVDLHSEGLPGLMSRLGPSWYYSRNLGGGRFADLEEIARVDDTNETTIDLTAEESETLAHGRLYQPMTTLRSTANVNHDDPYVGYIDLNGDDADDVVVADERVIRWYPSQGEDGFGDPVVMRLDTTEHALARRLHADAHQSFHVADMTGDGLYDLVRVRRNEVSYWPNQGRGRFGDRVVVDRSPELPEGGAGRERIMLVDLNGSGTADMVWVGDGEMFFWENLNGNEFGAPRRIVAQGLHSTTPGLAAVDLFGDGLACIVWIDQSKGPGAFRYVTPLSRTRPNLLVGIHTGSGRDLRWSYAPSTEFWLRDRAGGGSWLTALPRAEMVVDRVEDLDRIADTLSLTRFSYHHGYYDEREQRLAGFALIQRIESGTAADYEHDSLFADESLELARDPRRRAIPLLIKTWRHTGTRFEGGDLTVPLKDEFFHDPNLGRKKWLTGHQMPLGQQARDIPEGHRALRGQLLREEVFALDAPLLRDIPFSVFEQTAWVRQVQPGRGGKSPSYDVRRNETIVVDYERDTGDPRIHHHLVLALDEFGTEARSVDVAYGRKHSQHALQSQHAITVSDVSTISRNDQPTWYRIGVPHQTKTWQLLGMAGPGGSQLFEARELRIAMEELPEVDAVGIPEHPHKRMVGLTRWRYWSNDMTRELPVGALESRALGYCRDDLVFTSTLVDHLYGGAEAAETLCVEGGYTQEGHNFWASSPVTFYDPVHFYLPVRTRDAMGRDAKQRWALGDLWLEETEDAYGNVERHVMHPRVMKYWQSVDVNGNVIARRYDAVGSLLSEAVMGKPERNEADVLVLSSLESAAHDNPTTVFTRDHFAWLKSGKPTWMRSRRRERHKDVTTGLEDITRFFDAKGRKIATSRRVSAGRWVISDVVERDTRGHVIRVVAPFFSATTFPSDGEVRRALETATVLTRDPLGRVVRTDYPDGTFTTVDIGCWASTFNDENDNVLDSDWYAQRQLSTPPVVTAGSSADSEAAAIEARRADSDSRAAALAAASARTPRVELYDNAGRVIATRRTLIGSQIAERRFMRDWQGNVVVVIDAMGKVGERHTYDLLGRRVASRHADLGTRTYMLAATGETIRFRDPRGRFFRFEYDAAGRCTHKHSSFGGQPELLLERTIYGGGDIPTPYASDRNLVGRPHLRLTRSGLETIEQYSISGDISASTVRLTKRYAEEPDWSVVSDPKHAAQVVALLAGGESPVLASESFRVEATYDALGRMTNIKGLAGAISSTYAMDGLLQSCEVLIDGVATPVVVVSSVLYDEVGRALQVSLGDAAQLKRNYDARGRLQSVSVIGASGEHIYNVNAVRDPVGNIMSVGSNGATTAAFTYDAMNRAVRSHISGSSQAPEGFQGTYSFDLEGNLEETHLRGLNTTSARHFELNTGTNRVKSLTIVSDVDVPVSHDFRYDDAGNLISAGDDRVMAWDSFGRLSAIESDSTNVLYGYDADGNLLRRVAERGGARRDETVLLGPFERRRSYNDDEVIVDQLVVTVFSHNVPVAIVEATSPSGGEAVPRVNTRFQVADPTDSVTMELTHTGEVLVTKSYDATGVVRVSDPHLSTEAPVLASKVIGYKGGLVDPEADVVVLGKRWYSPDLGRWIDGVERGHDNPYAFDANEVSDESH